MKILLTNDDGIYAEGLYSLYRELVNDHHIIIVAPEVEQSAVGHALTLYNPLRVKRIKRHGRFYGFCVNGTPADCVKIAVSELMDGAPDMVVSGINLGPNVGINVLYSGTVSAATEGAILGIPAVAVSLNTYTDPDFAFASEFTKKLVEFIHQNVKGSGPHPRPDLTPLLNVNIPAIKAEMIKGIAITRQAVSRFTERFERRIDPRDNTYYWLAGPAGLSEGPAENPGREDEDTDSRALANGMISITPLHYDLTSYEDMTQLRKWKIELSK